MGFFSVDNMQRIKLAVHIIQAIFIFVSWCMLIAVFRGAIYVYGGPIWSFVLVCSPYSIIFLPAN